ncbi:uncharacterized protein TNCV_5047251 [Trichonephila clavipes]|nr:uncharacterized protein TNCV_5047251 [Trichonephila clavipes]
MLEKEARAPCIAVEMEAIASEAASGTNSAREAARRLGLPPSSARNILRRILQLYPYKLQSCHELLPVDTTQRKHLRNVREDIIVSRRCFGTHGLPRFPDLTPAYFWLWVYLKSRVYLSGPSSLSELKDAIRREVSSIHADVLHSTVAGFVTRLECLLPCGGGHVV